MISFAATTFVSESESTPGGCVETLRYSEAGHFTRERREPSADGFHDGLRLSRRSSYGDVPTGG